MKFLTLSMILVFWSFPAFGHVSALPGWVQDVLDETGPVTCGPRPT